MTGKTARPKSSLFSDSMPDTRQPPPDDDGVSGRDDTRSAQLALHECVRSYHCERTRASTCDRTPLTGVVGLVPSRTVVCAGPDSAGWCV